MINDNEALPPSPQTRTNICTPVPLLVKCTSCFCAATMAATAVRACSTPSLHCTNSLRDISCVCECAWVWLCVYMYVCAHRQSEGHIQIRGRSSQGTNCSKQADVGRVEHGSCQASITGTVANNGSITHSSAIDMSRWRVAKLIPEVRQHGLAHLLIEKKGQDKKRYLTLKNLTQQHMHKPTKQPTPHIALSY